MKIINNKTYYSTIDAAALIKVSRAIVHKWCIDNMINYIREEGTEKKNGKILIEESELNAFIKRRNDKIQADKLYKKNKNV